MKEIPLTKGKVALVDDGDFETASRYRWYAFTSAKSNTFYAGRTEWGPPKKVFLLHRVLMGAKAGEQVDHKDGNGLNCQRSNLRLASYAQNQMNAKTRKDSGSGYKGVRKIGNRWYARIKVDRQEMPLGGFPSAKEAARAYDCAARSYYGEFARPNFPANKAA